MPMDGTLWKWTNYFTGWQPRWFVLDDGNLSYYKSEDDVNSGCKGSIKMAVCDVMVHATDPTRLDLIIPGEQHFYLKAATPKERQIWLVALGSSKACMTDGGFSKKEGSTYLDEADFAVTKEDLKSKKSELRLYCDLLMQQVHSVKSSVSDSAMPNSQKLDEATSLLSATCDTFIQTLDDVMHLAQANLEVDSADDVAVDNVMPVLKRQTSKCGVATRVSTVDRYIPAPNVKASLKTHVRSVEDTGSQSKSSRSSSRTSSESSETISRNNKAVTKAPEDSTETGKQKKIVRSFPTFFSTLGVSFTDVCCHEDGSVPVLQFLDACSSLSAIFDKLSATAFAPVKMDFTGNIKKIRQKYSTNPKVFLVLQSLVTYEIKAKENLNPNSATQALLWLKRGLEFIKLFLHEIVEGEQDLSQAAHKAYDRSLKSFHGWVVRGMFGLAVKAAPYRNNFLEHLSVSKTHAASPKFQEQLILDMTAYINAMNIVLHKINQFYDVNDLDSKEQV